MPRANTYTLYLLKQRIFGSLVVLINFASFMAIKLISNVSAKNYYTREFWVEGTWEWNQLCIVYGT